MARVKGMLDRVLLVVASFIMVMLVAGAIWQVFSRYVLDAPSIITEELLRVGLIWAAMLGAAYAFGTNQHLSLTFLKEKLKGERRKRVLVANSLFVICFVIIVMIKGGMDLIFFTLDETTAILLLPRAVVNAALPVSGLIILFYQGLQLVELLRDKPESEDQRVDEEESKWM